MIGAPSDRTGRADAALAVDGIRPRYATGGKQKRPVAVARARGVTIPARKIPPDAGQADAEGRSGAG